MVCYAVRVDLFGRKIAEGHVLGKLRFFVIFRRDIRWLLNVFLLDF